MRRRKLIGEWGVEQLYRWAMFWERLAIAADRAVLTYLLEKRNQRVAWVGSHTSQYLDGARDSEVYEFEEARCA